MTDKPDPPGDDPTRAESAADDTADSTLSPEESALESEESTLASADPARSPEGSPFSLDDFYDAVEAEGRPVLTAQQVARRLDCSQSAAHELLTALAASGAVEQVDVETDPVVWFPSDWGALASRERVVLFPGRREVIVDQPTQYTRARLSQFAHLVDTTGTPGSGTRTEGAGGYLYRIRQEDVWAAPFEDLGDLLRAMRSVLPRRSAHLEEWVEDQWKRARQFTLRTAGEGEDSYTVLEAATENLMGNVARQKLSAEHLRAPISDTEAWVNDGAVAEIKRTLYEAGYPVRDERELESGDPLDVELTTDLRDYQREWVDRFAEQRSGVFVGPPGSGKTVAAIATVAHVGGETLVLVPSRELAGQWHEELLAHTTLAPEQIGEYHGGTKDVRPVTVATYQTAGMPRHRALFDDRRWGLIVYDEVQHIPSEVYRRSADLQAKHRLGLTATPVREDDREKEIFTLVGPPIGADWDALFEAGFVAEPEVEIRYVPWRDEMARNEYGSADGRERYRIAASNPAKIEEVRRLREAHADAKTLVFVDYLNQGRAMSAALDYPFISGETRHAERRRLFEEFRQGERSTLIISRVGDEGIDLPNAELAIVASGLGGSRRQGAQRAGRTMRPVGSALVFVLATRGTREEDFAQRQMRHLAEKGIRVRERTVDDGGEGGSEGGEGGSEGGSASDSEASDEDGEED